MMLIHTKPYAVTKAAQIHLAKTLAVICAPKIRVNSVSPGLLMTVNPSPIPAVSRPNNSV